MNLQDVTFKDAAIVIYLVMFVITAVCIWWHAGGDRRYRATLSIVLGMFWPLPAAILIYLYIHGMLNSIIKWFDRNFN